MAFLSKLATLLSSLLNELVGSMRKKHSEYSYWNVSTISASWSKNLFRSQSWKRGLSLTHGWNRSLLYSRSWFFSGWTDRWVRRGYG